MASFRAMASVPSSMAPISLSMMLIFLIASQANAFDDLLEEGLIPQRSRKPSSRFFGGNEKRDQSVSYRRVRPEEKPVVPTIDSVTMAFKDDPTTTTEEGSGEVDSIYTTPNPTKISTSAPPSSSTSTSSLPSFSTASSSSSTSSPSSSTAPSSSASSPSSKPSSSSSSPSTLSSAPADSTTLPPTTKPRQSHAVPFSTTPPPSPPPPPIKCASKLRVPKNSRAECSGDKVGDECAFICDAGFVKMTPKRREAASKIEMNEEMRKTLETGNGSFPIDAVCVVEGSSGVGEWQIKLDEEQLHRDALCVDVDECALGDNSALSSKSSKESSMSKVCNPNSDEGFLCRNLPGSFECVCPRGHFASNGRCRPLIGIHVLHPLKELTDYSKNAERGDEVDEEVGEEVVEVEDDREMHLRMLWSKSLNISVDDVRIRLDEYRDGMDLHYEVELRAEIAAKTTKTMTTTASPTTSASSSTSASTTKNWIVERLSADKAFDSVYVDDRDECSDDPFFKATNDSLVTSEVENRRLCEDLDYEAVCKNVPWTFECVTQSCPDGFKLIDVKYAEEKEEQEDENQEEPRPKRESRKKKNKKCVQKTSLFSSFEWPSKESKPKQWRKSLASIKIVIALVVAFMIATITSIVLCFVLCYSRRRHGSLSFHTFTFASPPMENRAKAGGGGGGEKFTPKDNLAFDLGDELNLTDLTASSGYVEETSFNERFVD